MTNAVTTPNIPLDQQTSHVPAYPQARSIPLDARQRPVHLTILPPLLRLVLYKRDIVALAAQYKTHASHHRDATFWKALSRQLKPVLDFLNEVKIEATLAAVLSVALSDGNAPASKPGTLSGEPSCPSWTRIRRTRTRPRTGAS